MKFNGYRFQEKNKVLGVYLYLAICERGVSLVRVLIIIEYKMNKEYQEVFLFL